MHAHLTDHRRDWLRLLGGLLFTAGALVLVIRKAQDWGAGAEFLTLIVPCALCLGLGIAGRHSGLLGRRAGGLADRFEPWRSTLLVIGILLLPIALFRLVGWVGGDTNSSLNALWIFGLTAAVAALLSLRLRASYQLLVAGLAGIVAWLSLWDKVLDNPKADTVRWLLLALAAIYVALAFLLHRREGTHAGGSGLDAAREGATPGGVGTSAVAAGGAEPAMRHRDLERDDGDARRRHGDLITAAGIAAIAAGMITLLLLLGRLPSLSRRIPVSGSATPSELWNVLLLLESLALIAYAAWSGLRGPGYVGAFGLLAFVVIVGINFGALVDGDQPHKVLGWPVILLALGAVLLILGYVLRAGPHRGAGGRGGGPPAGGIPAAAGPAVPGTGRRGVGLDTPPTEPGAGPGQPGPQPPPTA